MRRLLYLYLIVVGVILHGLVSVDSYAATIKGKPAGLSEGMGEAPNSATFAFDATNAFVHLTMANGNEIGISEVKDLYGTSNGMTIYVNGNDIASRYKPVGMDLSDKSGYPNIKVTHGYVAIDPTLGRFKFPEGDNDLITKKIHNPTINALSVQKAGKYLYVADGQNGIKIFDTASVSGANPGRFSLIGEYKTSDYALDIYVNGKYAYVSTGDSGITILDITNPNIPTLMAKYDTPGHATGVTICGEYAYVADGHEGLLILNVSNPVSPVVMGSCSVQNYAMDVCIASSGTTTYAYVADALDGLMIINVTNPGSPVLKGRYNTPGYAARVYIKDKYAYVADGIGGLVIVDISNPVQPVLAGQYKASDTRASYISGEYAYLADGASGLQVINISNHGSPTSVGRYNTPGCAVDVCVSDGYAYVADENNGLLALDVPCSSEVPEGIITVDYHYGPVPLNISVDFITNKNKYIEEEFVRGTVSVTNTGVNAITLIFPSNQMADIKVRDTNNHLVWIWSNGSIFNENINEIRLAPAETKPLLSAYWNQNNMTGNPVVPGTYTIQAYMVSGIKINGTQSLHPTILAAPREIVIAKPGTEEIGDGGEYDLQDLFELDPPAEAEIKRGIGKVTIGVPEIKVIDILANGDKYQRCSIVDGGLTSEIGKPELPAFGTYIEIPDGVELNVEVIERGGTFTLSEGHNIYPVQEPLIDAYEDEVYRGEGIIGTINTTVYSTNKFYPEKIISVDESTMLRGHRVTSLMIYPLQYNPVTKQLKRWSKIVLNITYAGGAEVDIKGIDPRLEDDEFESLCSSFVLNYKDPEEYEGRDDESGGAEPSFGGAEYLIITHDDFYEAVQPLAEWKRKKGLKTQVVKTSEIPDGSTAEGIKQYIKTAYTTWNPAPVYLLLVGDVDKVPTNYGNSHPYHKTKTGTDLYYATMYAGQQVGYPDYSPDLFVGRLSVKTAADTRIIVDKILNYEKNPGGGNTNWFKNILYAAYLQNKSTGKAERFFLQTAETVRKFMKEEKGYQYRMAYVHRYTADNYAYYYGDPIDPEAVAAFTDKTTAKDRIIDAINSGCLIAIHRDHGESRNWEKGKREGWVDPPFVIDDIDRLNNGQMLPVVFSLNCMSGWFDGETDEHSPSFESIGERLLREEGKGAIGFIAATRISYSGYNDEMAKGFFDAIWQDFNQNYPSSKAKSLPKLGPILNYGKMYMYNSRITTAPDAQALYPWRPTPEHMVTEFEEFNLQGDPELAIWTTMPKEFKNIAYPSQVPQGQAILEVQAGVSEAMVCVMQGELHEGTKTDRNGKATLNIDKAIAGEMSVTVTKHNYLPYEGTITIGGETTDPSIYSPWDDPLAVWDDPDINTLDMPGAEKIYRIKATIHNNKPITANNLNVTFKWARLGIGQEWNPIGTKTINVAANSAKDAMIDWTLPQGVLGSDCGFMVEISHPQDKNTKNNKGVENYSLNYIVDGELVKAGEFDDETEGGEQIIKLPFSIYNNTLSRGNPSFNISSFQNYGAEVKFPYSLGAGEKATATLEITVPAGVEMDLATFNVTGKINNQILGGISFDILVDNLSQLLWLTTPGFEDGFEPNTGTSCDSFMFKINYKDKDNHQPPSGYPGLHILSNGKEIPGSPFVGSAENIADTNYTDGKNYNWTIPLVTSGTYTYFFEVKDRYGLTATGTPTILREGPVVRQGEGIPVSLIAPTTLSAGSEFWAEVFVGSSTQSIANLLGMSLKLKYAGAIEVATTTVSNSVRQGSLFGQDIIFVANTDKENQIINIGCSRKGTSSMGTNSHGVIARVKFRIPPAAASGATATLTISDIEASSSNGQTIKFVSTPAQMVVAKIPVSLQLPSFQSPSSEFWADVRVGTITDLYALSVDMKVDPQIISIPDISISFLSGELMSSQVLMPMGEINNQTGYLTVHITRMGDIPGVNGQGNVLRIRFKVAENAGSQTTLSITKATGYDSTGEIIGLTPGGGAVLRIGGVSVWPGDTNNDGVVNEHDILPIGLYWQKTGGARQDATIQWGPQSVPAWIPQNAVYADANGDRLINAMDILAIGRNWGRTHTVTTTLNAPAIFTGSIDYSLYVDAYKAMYDVLEKTEETAAIKTLKDTLQKLIIKAAQPLLPAQDELLQNYPNPFNPETWIPFNLTETAQVVIKIYNISGQLIRTLDVGVKEPGRYISRDRAAYWDGFNANGDEAASGVYFYQIHAGNYVSTRQMVVLK